VQQIGHLQCPNGPLQSNAQSSAVGFCPGFVLQCSKVLSSAILVGIIVSSLLCRRSPWCTRSYYQSSDYAHVRGARMSNLGILTKC
jgi:hypothetical protein